MKQHADVVVVGGGIAGTSTAYFLRKAGVDVVLVERGDIACGASGRNGGGFRQSARSLEEMPLAVATIKMAMALWEELGENVEYVRLGNLRLAESEEQLQAMAESVPKQQKAGLKDIRMVSRQEAIEIVPALNPAHVFGGHFCPTDGHINPMAACQALARGARRLGAEILLGTAVTGIDVEHGKVAGVRTTAGRIATPWVVNAAGAGAFAVAALAGLHLQGRVGTMQGMITERAEPIFPVMFGVASASIYFRQTVSGNILYGGGGGRRPNESEPPPGVQINQVPIAPASDHLLDLIPALRNLKLLRIWTGQDALSPDHNAVLGPSPSLEGFLYATCLSGHGMPMGPTIGRLLTEFITEGETSIELTGLEASRYSN